MVVTVFGGAPSGREKPPWWLRPFADRARRHTEHTRALALRGAASSQLGFVEWAFGEKATRRLGGAFRAHRADSPNIPAIAEAIDTIRARHPHALVLAPLGVGFHVDHLEVFAAALDVVLRTNDAGILFYEDVYAMVDAARKKHVVTGDIALPPVHGLRMRSLRPRVMAGFLKWAMGDRRVPIEAVSKMHWSVEAVDISAHEGPKLAAIGCYGSQLGALGGRAWLRALGAHHRRWGMGEPLWRCVAR